jgi:hypothetical protein
MVGMPFALSLLHHKGTGFRYPHAGIAAVEWQKAVL